MIIIETELYSFYKYAQILASSIAATSLTVERGMTGETFW